MFKIFVSINAFLFVLYCHSMDQEGQVDPTVLALVYNFNIKKKFKLSNTKIWRDQNRISTCAATRRSQLPSMPSDPLPMKLTSSREV